MSDVPEHREALPRRRPPAAPLFAALLAYCGGVLLASRVYKPAGLYFACTLAFALCSLLALRFGARWRARLAYAAAALAFFPAGGLIAAAHGSRTAPVPALLSYADGDEVTITGYVARSGSLRSGRDLRESLDMAVEQAQREGEAARPVTGTARLSLYVPGSRSHFSYETEEDGLDEAVAPPLLDYGQRLRVRAKLRPPSNYRNPGNMDYVSWLRGQGVSVLGSAASTHIDVLPGAGGSAIERQRWRLRRAILQRMEQLWPAPYAGLFQAMILGERGLVERGQRMEFQRSGTFHLLVVSGMNVAIFAVFLLWLARRLRLPAECGILAALLLTCGYAWLTDLAAPILRSVLMIAAYQVAALLNRQRAPLNTVALAALALLAADPGQLFEASFQLTFLAVLTIDEPADAGFDAGSRVLIPGTVAGRAVYAGGAVVAPRNPGGGTCLGRGAALRSARGHAFRGGDCGGSGGLRAGPALRPAASVTGLRVAGADGRLGMDGLRAAAHI